MRTVTTTLLAALAALSLLAACGDDGAAARAQKIKDLEAQLEAHRATYGTLQPGWQEIRVKVIPARQAYMRAKGSPDEAAAKEALDAAVAASQETHDAETEWRRKENELVDALSRLKP